MKKVSENLDISIESVFMQLPGYAYWRDLNNNFLGGNLMVAKLAGLRSSRKLEGLSDFNAPWSKFAESYKQQDYDAYNGLIYKQLDPVMSADGFKVLTATKGPYYDKNGDVAAIVGLGVELTGKDIIEIAHLIDSETPFSQGKSIIISNQNYVYAKCEKKLTQRELECMFYLMRGRSYKRIAKILNISPRTVEEYITNVKLKFGCNTKDELIEIAHKYEFTRFIPESLVNDKLLASLHSN
ncbi:MAG: helix-turn-helix transcriptional regulator [Alphaproteobacteria bacterium]|nr:helix-turn-helix transcriptional regulator [Alphaproteobacteria bacterium]